jgi:histidinol dehydrogenase
MQRVGRVGYSNTHTHTHTHTHNEQVVEDSIALARIEGLEAHARAAEIRKLK